MMKCTLRLIFGISPALTIALALALPERAAAQTSDVTEAPAQPQASLQTAGRTPRQHAWQPLPQFGGASLSGRGTSSMKARGGALAGHSSSTDAAPDAMIGIDPDLARPLVPCDAIGQSARGARHSRSGALSGSYALGAGPGETAGAGYDPASGMGSLPPAVSSCVSVQTSRDEASADERTTGVYEQLSPDVTHDAAGSSRPGTLTLLRPFAN